MTASILVRLEFNPSELFANLVQAVFESHFDQFAFNELSFLVLRHIEKVSITEVEVNGREMHVL